MTSAIRECDKDGLPSSSIFLGENVTVFRRRRPGQNSG